MTRLWLRFLLLCLAVAGVVAVAPQRQALAQEGCAFPFTPTAYEDLKDRRLFLDTIDLAAHNLLFPGDAYFGLPPIEFGPRNARQREAARVPPLLLRAIGWIESSITQAAVEVPFGSIGPALISFDCGHGIAQVTTGMTVPTGEAGRGSPQQALVATHFAYNVARGAAILADKWNKAPEELPIAGTDTNGHPGLLENWYYAIWAYNGFTGPGANRSNHPLDPIYAAWPRPAYSCGPSGDGKGHNRAKYPYQELVIGCATHPPIVEGRPLWQAQPISLPELGSPTFKGPLGLSNFVFPYSRMDIPSPQPFHQDITPPPDPALRQRVLGSPQLAVSKTDVKIGVAAGSGSTSEAVSILNAGTGVLAWYAVATEPWINLGPYTGVAVGGDLPCAPNVPCDRAGRIDISVDPSRAPPGRRSGAVRIQALGSEQAIVVNVEVSPVVRIGVPGVTRD